MTTLTQAVASLLASSEINEALRACWQGDQPLLDVYHRKAPCSLDEAVADTTRLLLEADGEVFGLLVPKYNVVGIIGFQSNRTLLTAFGLRAAWRTDEGKAMLWDAFNELTGGAPVLVGVYFRNARASAFIARQPTADVVGTQICPETGESIILYTL